jgi:hypothetical protein
MAECRRFVCSGCGEAIEAWSDGNPFYVDETGNKKYAYHPNHDELEKCTANDVPHLCLQCGAVSKIDSRLGSKACPECRSVNLAGTFHLDGAKCPKCEKGQFVTDKDFRRIS